MLKKPIVGVEPTTFYLQGKCSTTKLYRPCYKPEAIPYKINLMALTP